MGAIGNRRQRAVFLDRDGVINRNVYNPATGEFESPLTVADFALIPGALNAMRALRSAGFCLFLVSNQPNLAKGKSTLEQLSAIHQKFLSGLAEAAVGFAEFYYCFHHPNGVVSGYSRHCECRKPSPHFLLTASSQFDVDLRRSWMVGDRQTDIECGGAAGTRTILIQSARPHAGEGTRPDAVAPDLRTAAQLILSADQSRGSSSKRLPGHSFQSGRRPPPHLCRTCLPFRVNKPSDLSLQD